jgi:hypothetical protein
MTCKSRKPDLQWSLIETGGMNSLLRASGRRHKIGTAGSLTRNLTALEKLHSYVHCTVINTVAFDHGQVSQQMPSLIARPVQPHFR